MPVRASLKKARGRIPLTPFTREAFLMKTPPSLYFSPCILQLAALRQAQGDTKSPQPLFTKRGILGLALGYGWKNTLPSRTSISRMPMPKHTATNPIVSHSMILRPLSHQGRLNCNPLRDCKKGTPLPVNIGREIESATGRHG